MGFFPVAVPENINPPLSLLRMPHQTESHKLRFPGKDLLLLFFSLNLVKEAASHSSNQVGCVSVETSELQRGNHSVRGSTEQPHIKTCSSQKVSFQRRMGNWAYFFFSGKTPSEVYWIWAKQGFWEDWNQSTPRRPYSLSKDVWTGISSGASINPLIKILLGELRGKKITI